MRTIELRSHGFEGLVATERPTPRPGPRDVLVRMRATSLNFRDLAILRGEYGAFPLPLVLGSDGAGDVVGVGAEVTRFAIGDRVCPTYVPDWIAGPPNDRALRRRLGGPLDGTLSELVVVPEEAAVAVPSHLSNVEAATLPVAGVSAWQALFVASTVVPGDVVVVQGTGGVSTFALQLGRLAGARVIVTSSDDAKLARAKELGAAFVVNYVARPDWDRAVLEHTGGRGADVTIDVAGGDGLNRSIAATRVGGVVSLLGFVAGATAHVDVPAAIRRGVTIRAATGTSRESFEALVRALEASGSKPVVDRVFPLGDLRAAFEHLARGKPFGKVVISWQDD